MYVYEVHDVYISHLLCICKHKNIKQFIKCHVIHENCTVKCLQSVGWISNHFQLINWASTVCVSVMKIKLIKTNGKLINITLVIFHCQVWVLIWMKVYSIFELKS